MLVIIFKVYMDLDRATWGFTFSNISAWPLTFSGDGLLLGTTSSRNMAGEQQREHLLGSNSTAMDVIAQGGLPKFIFANVLKIHRGQIIQVEFYSTPPLICCLTVWVCCWVVLELCFSFFCCQSSFTLSLLLLWFFSVITLQSIMF